MTEGKGSEKEKTTGEEDEGAGEALIRSPDMFGKTSESCQ